jgi:exodeoxyribonuclease V beta subunit
MKPFDPFEIELRGSSLIEASAGTGKTHAIASLYVRLLLERALQVREILVVTFTEAATDDLRKRIRERLWQTLLVFEGNPTEDLFFERLLSHVTDPRQAVRILHSAIQSLDEAAIFTIHGFCQRILHENAFETASLFDTELVTDQRDILQEIVEDFWRIHFYNAPPLFLSYVRVQGLGPKQLIDLLGNSISNPFLKIIPQVKGPDVEELALLEDQVLRCYQEAQSVWGVSRRAIEELLSRHPGLNQQSYSAAMILRQASEVERYLSLGSPLPVSQALKKFCSSEIAGALKKGFTSPPTHPFFPICEDLQQDCGLVAQAYDRRLLELKSKLFLYVKEELKKRKQQQNVRYFDDLLLDLQEILQSSRGHAVAESVRSRYKAALIDEFQDTDPIQYAIFDAVFTHPQTALFLIGDPKQAIYSFRGADIFAYIKASRSASERYTLTNNWRSTPRLLAATNVVFGRKHLPFLFPEIGFSPATPAHKPSGGGFTWLGRPDPSPLKLWFMNRKPGQTGGLINKGDANEAIPNAVAAAILRLLEAGGEGLALVGGKPLSPWDIAVLVRTNREAKFVQEALQELKIPSVRYSDENVLASSETLDVTRILEAIVDPSESKVKAALATDVFGLSGNDLAILDEDEDAWSNWLGTFANYRDIWLDDGFMPMARILIGQQKVRARLLSYIDGERRLTNLLHCFELLHQAVLQHSLGLEGLLKWLAKRHEEPRALRSEEYQLRLETDAKAVNVLTIHKSKGLEYPIVFNPFCWNRVDDQKEVTFHDETERETLIRDIGSDELAESLKLAERESFAEDIRLLYVALTRAKYRCYLVWGAIRDAEKSALAYLLHAGRTADPFRQVPRAIGNLSDSQLKDELAELVASSDGSIEVSDLPEPAIRTYSPPPEGIGSYVCRHFCGEIEQNWGIASFTSLVSEKLRSSDSRDRDRAISVPWSPDSIVAEESLVPLHHTSKEEKAKIPPLKGVQGDVSSGELTPAATIFSFPRGSRAGLFFHEVLQGLDFTAGPSPDNTALVWEKLAMYGIDSVWEEPVWQTIGQVLSMPLEQKNPALRLSRIPREERLHEVEFTLPLDLLTPTRLKKAFAHVSAFEAVPEFSERLAQLGFSPVKGLMRGYIDMIFRWEGRFYLVDWKSNFLGSTIEAYGQDCLRETMRREFYLLQSALYSVALHRYLSFRVPGYDFERHFGGAFYVFLRGVNSAKGPEFGIFRDRPSGELVSELSRCLTHLW